ncbi:MAG: LPS export ABC transporter ATP-binding protein [Planctomycetes bacterium]|nr:LPS export ABC transporter ATP-binding protein [Planctomycetota bacterium]
MPLLHVSSLVKSYGSRTVVDGVSFDMDAGEIIGLLGPNGAGKTTTFRMTIGMIRPDKGSVHLNGEDVTHLPVYQHARRGIGYLAQEPSVFQRLTTEKNLLAILETRSLSRAQRRERCESLLQEFGLGQVRGQMANTLSGGEKRRLEMARALITEPRLLMLDEPFNAIDPITVEEIQKVIRRLAAKDIGILLTDHHVRETLAVTDRSYIISNGQILAQGSQEDILANVAVRKIYLGEQFSM